MENNSNPVITLTINRNNDGAKTPPRRKHGSLGPIDNKKCGQLTADELSRKLLVIKRDFELHSQNPLAYMYAIPVIRTAKVFPENSHKGTSIQRQYSRPLRHEKQSIRIYEWQHADASIHCYPPETSSRVCPIRQLLLPRQVRDGLLSGRRPEATMGS